MSFSARSGTFARKSSAAIALVAHRNDWPSPTSPTLWWSQLSPAAAAPFAGPDDDDDDDDDDDEGGDDDDDGGGGDGDDDGDARPMPPTPPPTPVAAAASLVFGMRYPRPRDVGLTMIGSDNGGGGGGGGATADMIKFSRGCFGRSVLAGVEKRGGAVELSPPSWKHNFGKLTLSYLHRNHTILILTGIRKIGGSPSW